MNRKPVIIKKYENRRLYDTANSRYINQDEVAQMLKSGYEVQVVDAATGEDLTRLVLTQIIVEQAKAPDSAFPLDILRQMVVASSRATQESTLQYMKTVVGMYENAYRAMAPQVSPFEFMRGTPRRDIATEAPMREPGGAETGAGEVDELKRRVAELESRISRRAAPKARKAKTRSRRKS